MRIEKPKNEKYVFRFYRTRPAPKGFDYSIESPYKDKFGFAYKMGDVIKAPDEDANVEPELRPNYYFHAPKDDSGKLLQVPHKGLSVIGLSDPMYSMYDIRHINRILGSSIGPKGTRLIDSNNILVVPPSLKRMPPEMIRNILENAIYGAIGVIDDDDDFIENDDDGTNRSRLMSIIDNLMDDIKTKDSNTLSTNDLQQLLTSTIPNYAADKEVFTQSFNDNIQSSLRSNIRKYNVDMKDEINDPGTEIQKDNNDNLFFNRYDNLLDALASFGRSGLWGDAFVASVPLSAIYNINDYAKGRTRGQADFPEELKVRKLRLLNNLSDDGSKTEDSTLTKFLDTYDKWNIPRRQRYDDIKRRRLIDALNSTSLPGEHFEIPIEGTAAHKQLLKDIDDAKNILAETIDIDPDEITSDELCKDIWYDLSSYFDKKDRQHNIVKGLSGGDNKWKA